MSNPIEEYGLIGDGQTAALVHQSGSIDWLCLPRFDSDACFAALLGTADNGCWKLAPVDSARTSRRYAADTLILETEFETGSGAVRLTDFMPIGRKHPALIRMVRGLRGRVAMRGEMNLCFDYGSVRPWLEVSERRAVAHVGPDLIVLHSPCELHKEGNRVVCEFDLGDSEERSFTFLYGSSQEGDPSPVDGGEALRVTLEYWREWIGRFEKETDWPDVVRRSLITVNGMIYRPTGGMIAAPTTSLPERSGNASNWDYRYCWIRDAAFSLIALVDAGYQSEATKWRNWLVRAVAGDPGKIRILYRIDGSRRLEEWVADWLPGYRWIPPVRIGNAAASQRQLDIFGELLDSVYIGVQAGIERTAQEDELLDGIVKHVESVWRLPDNGLWESRGQPRHFVYSKVSAWVAIDRYIRYREAHEARASADLDRTRALRQEIHDEICHEGYISGLGHFVDYFGSESLDASLLLLPLLGFLPVEDERIAGTIDAIEKHLVVDGLVHRKMPQPHNPEGAFLACSCWLADCQLMQGRREAARKTFERVLAVRNDLGLLAEEYDVDAKRFTGNFPQTLSHVAVLRTALRFAGVVTERGGGISDASRPKPAPGSRTRPL